MMPFAAIRRFRFSVVPLFALCAFLLSCKTAPHYPDAVLEESANIPLEEGALAYVLADVQASRPILDLVPIQGMDAKQAGDMLDRTKSLVAALYPPESGRQFQLTAWGNYPDTRANMAFGMSRDWKKQRSASGEAYWYSAASGVSVALNKGQAFIVSAADSEEPFAALPGVQLPEGFGEFRRGAIIACWLENPGTAINRVFAQMGIPLQFPADRVFVSLFLVPGPAAEVQYQALIRIETPGSSQARSLAAILNLARNFGAGPPQRTSGEADTEEPDFGQLLGALLFANAPIQDGSNLNLKTAMLTKKDAALLFRAFSVYFDYQN